MRGWFYKFENTNLTREDRKLRLGMTDMMRALYLHNFVACNGNPLLLGRPVVPAQAALGMIGPIASPYLQRETHHYV